MDIYPTSQEARVLLTQQLKDWEQARLNFEALAKIQTKEFSFGDFSIRIQFNPGRIQSSAAKIDDKSIQERKCFLCAANLPVVQKGLPCGKDYQLLINPFPIFPQHFTIPCNEHTDQLIYNRYTDMLDLAEKLDLYSFFYNGPKCGASAPDHAHFQAGNKGFMPIEEDVKRLKKEILYTEKGLRVYAIRDYLRSTFLLEAEDKQSAVAFFKYFYSLLTIQEGESEPMINIITWYEGSTWFSCIFPREKHRPTCFSAEGDSNILISPASVDFGGVFITPLEKDFNKITSIDVQQILKEVSISDEKMNEIITRISNKK